MTPDARRVLTADQCREARALLGISQDALARKAGVYGETVQRFEEGRPGTFPIRSKLRTALEAAGIEFTGDTAGVRLRTTKSRGGPG